MKILVITSCTGEKAVDSPDQLTLADFRRGHAHVAAREAALAALWRPAELLYSGMQHQRLMRGVQAARASAGLVVDLNIVSAGYGLVPGAKLLAPYEATFIGMKKAEARDWAKQLNLARDVRQLLARPYDLGLVLLGDDYLEALALDECVTLGGPTILFCGKASAARLPDLGGLQPVVLANKDATRFSCGMVGIKGELASRVLERLSLTPEQLPSFVAASAQVLDQLAGEAPIVKVGRVAARVNLNVDRVIDIPTSWREKPHRAKLSYFIPEWDDLVDPDFDFETDTHSGGSGDWSNEVYAHQMYPEPNYDGILISKVIAEKSKKKAERINRLGVHRFLRVPRDFPVMGDCGAFGYINESVPPYTTSEILDYYTRLDFDSGVSIDHFAIGEEADRLRRYQLTIANADDFLVEHKKLGLAWNPIGAVQGWDEASFSKAAQQYVAMGYKYIALGAMVRRRTPEILSIVETVRKVIPADMRLHLFGVARLNAVHDLARAGVNSADSASALRKAWMGTGNNYLGVDGQHYAAIRIPEAEKSFRAKRMVTEGRAPLERVHTLELACIDSMHAFDRGEVSVDSVLNKVHEYDQLITPDRPDNRALLRRTLEARPWKECPCDICRKDGIDVIIFRGNNRNRRRGFHNTYTFYQLFQRTLAGERILPGEDGDEESTNQMRLFEVEAGA